MKKIEKLKIDIGKNIRTMWRISPSNLEMADKINEILDRLAQQEELNKTFSERLGLNPDDDRLNEEKPDKECEHIGDVAWCECDCHYKGSKWRENNCCEKCYKQPDKLQDKYQCPYGKGDVPRCLRNDDKLQELREWVEEQRNSIKPSFVGDNVINQLRICDDLLDKIKELGEK